MMADRKPTAIVLRTAFAGVCCLGIWESLNFARADFYFRKDTVPDIHTAINLISDGWPYYMRLAQLDQDHTKALLERTVELNPFNAQANIELGLRYEAEGDLTRAERQLLAAYDVDHTYLPRWSLANYYFRRDNMPEFWKWARSAAAMPSDDIGGLLELCWRASASPDEIAAALMNQKPEFLRQLVRFLLAKNQPGAASQVASNLMRVGDAKSDLNVMLSVVDESVSQGDSSAAISIWKNVAASGWITADSTIPNNAHFGREPIQSRFDWLLPEYNGLHSWPGEKGLQTEFSGDEPESCTIAEQAIVLDKGRYVLNSEFQSSGIEPGTGVKWQVIDPKSQNTLSESDDLSSNEMRRAELEFSVSEPTILLLRLSYRRALGTVRVAGTLNVRSVEIKKI